MVLYSILNADWQGVWKEEKVEVGKSKGWTELSRFVMYEAVQDLKEIRECVREERKEIGWKKWIWSVWDVQMIRYINSEIQNMKTKVFKWE